MTGLIFQVVLNPVSVVG